MVGSNELTNLGASMALRGLELDLERPGRYELVVSARPPGVEAPDCERVFTVVADSSAGIDLAWDRATSSGDDPSVYAAGTRPPSALVLNRSVPPGGDPEELAPIDGLELELRRSGTLVARRGLEGTLALEPLPCSLFDVARDPTEIDVDGQYELVVRGRSSAGVEAQARLTWTRAARGPEIALDGLPIDRWKPSSTGERNWWRLAIPISDPNGVDQGDVECVLRPVPSAEGPRLAGAENGDPARALRPDHLELRNLADGRYLLDVAYAFDHLLSRSTLELEVRARDAHGNATTAVERLSLGEIRPDYPRRVAIQADGLALADMLWVEVGRNYVLGGREDSIEGEALRRSGHDYPYGDEVSWRLEYNEDELEHYYLDEREVSVGDFLAFVQAGYMEPRFWSDTGEVPRAERRDELAAALALLDPDLPCERARWAEACAFAAWAGKRLQSVFEWEYAVRGSSYRPCTLRLPVEAIEAGLGAGPRSTVGNGGDMSSAGVRQLCTNAAEWTSSPALELSSRGRPLEAAKPYLIAPYSGPSQAALARASAFWLVGGSHAEPRYHDFSQHYAVDRREQAGFRCAMPADLMLERMGSSDQLQRVSFVRR